MLLIIATPGHSTMHNFNVTGIAQDIERDVMVRVRAEFAAFVSRVQRNCVSNIVDRIAHDLREGVSLRYPSEWLDILFPRCRMEWYVWTRHDPFTNAIARAMRCTRVHISALQARRHKRKRFIQSLEYT